MKKNVSLIIVLSFVVISLTSTGLFASDAVSGISARSAILYCVDNKKIVYEKDSNDVLPMASLTKVMTAAVVLESVNDLDEPITIPPEACGIEGSSIYLTAGERLTTRQLLYALMLESANDAATALAISVSGSVDAFVELMNEKASKLSLTSTHFTNPHGLDNEDHYSCAYDLALLFADALQNKYFAEIVSTKKYEIPYADDPNGRLLINHNRLLTSYDHCIGGKTGYTKRCGRCLISASSKDGVTLIAVTIDDPDDWDDHRKLFDYGFSMLNRYTLIADGTFTGSHVINGNSDTVRGYVTPLSIVMSRDEYDSIRPVYQLKRFYFAPIKKNSSLGTILWISGNELIAKTEITSTADIESIKYKRSIFDKIADLFK